MYSENWWQSILINVVTVALGYFSGGWFARRKAKADAKGSEIANLAAQVDLTRSMLATWEEQYNTLRAQYDVIKTQMEKLQSDFDTYKQASAEKIKKLECENQKLSKDVLKLK